MADDTTGTADAGAQSTPAPAADAPPAQDSTIGGNAAQGRTNRTADLKADAFSRAEAALGAAEADAPPAGDPPPTEPPAEVVDDQPKRTESDAWAAIDARERKVTKIHADLRAAEATHKAAVEQWQTDQTTQRTAHETLFEAQTLIGGGDIISGLSKLGLSYKDVTVAQLNSGQTPPDIGPQLSQFEAKLLERDKRIDALEEERAAAVTAAEQARMDTFVSGELGTDTGDRWALLQSDPAVNAVSEVQQLVLLEWQNAGSPVDAQGNAQPTLTISEAADKLEAHLLTQAQRFGSIPKLRTLWGQPQPAPSPATPAVPGQNGNGNQPVPTLTNTHAADAVRAAPSSDPAECMRRALAVAIAQDKET